MIDMGESSEMSGSAPRAGADLSPVLGIETSCDETAAAVLARDGRILAETVLSQQEHVPFGGVVPEIAARAHLAHLPDLVDGVMTRAGLGFAELGGVAASSGPGLIGGLIVGSGFAKGLSLARGLPFVAVNHLEAHALTARLPGLFPEPVTFPYLLLLVSGGHCQLVEVRGIGQYRRLGGTIDDAVGEAFDKVAKLLGLGWPGGPQVERLAATGDPGRYPLPRPLFGRPGCDFSFSGLKTAVAQLVASFPSGPLRMAEAADIAASFQRSVADVLADRTKHAMAAFAALHGPAPLVVAGGVAANAAIRIALERIAGTHGFHLLAPPARLCTDNAVMVAWAGIERLRLGLTSDLGVAPRPRWPLDSDDMRPPCGIGAAAPAAR
jgi:N6-L-threonylcarbamoyladenine synthase